METFILLAVLFLVFGGCGRACRRGVPRALRRMRDRADGRRGVPGTEDAPPGRGARSAGLPAGERGRRAGGRGATAAPRRDPGPRRMAPDDPRRLASLKDRFVRGELTLEEYEREVDKLDLRL